jgi:T-complex protein 1 subunit alpha
MNTAQPTLPLLGNRTTGKDVRQQNGLILVKSHFIVLAVSAVANILKSSLGPVGLDKMLVDDIGVLLNLTFIIVLGRYDFE